jgi:Sec-independent protein secretion pathway component TatC
LRIGEVVATQIQVRALPAAEIGRVLAILGVFGVVFQVPIHLGEVVLVAVVTARLVTVSPG